MSVEQKIDALAAKVDALLAALAAGGFAGAGAAAASSSSGIEDDGSSHASILAYDELINGHGALYIAACDKIDGLKNLGEHAKTAFAELRNVLRAAVQCKKPTPEAFQKFAAPLIAVSAAADKAIDNRSQFFPHQKAAVEFLAAFGWVFIAPTPMGHVQAQLESADFYLNKILTTFKADENKEFHRQFVKAIKDLLKDMQPFIKAFHTTGLVWNAKGKDLSEFGAAAAPAAAASAGPAIAGPKIGGSGGPPMGISAPPAGIAVPAAASAEPSGVGLGAVFASINAGHESLVSGLKKVTKDMKNKPGKPASDLPAVVVPRAKAPEEHKSAAASVKAAAPAQEARMFEKQGKWFVEHFQGGQVTLNADELNQKQNVYIYKCVNTLITVPSKCKAICVDSCSKTNVICQSVVSTVEIVNCKNLGVQVNETVPAVAIDKSSSVQLYLSATAVAANPDIVTSNITAVNVVVPGKLPEDDPIELSLPEQFMTKFDSPFTVSTNCTDHHD